MYGLSLWQFHSSDAENTQFFAFFGKNFVLWLTLGK